MLNLDFIQQLKNGDDAVCLVELSCKNNVLYLTTSDKDFVFGRQLYISGIITGNLSIDNLEKTDNVIIQVQNGVFDKLNGRLGQNISQEELLQSKVLIKYATKTQNIIVFRGFVESLKENNSTMFLTVASNSAKLQQTVGQLFSPLCRECFGSKKCGIDISQYNTEGEITSIISQDSFIGTHQQNSPKEAGYYQYGMIKFLTGSLYGISMQLQDEQDGRVFLLNNTRLLKVGDKYEIYAGCNKTLKMCQDKFKNAINFRGEPFINNE